MSSGPHIVSIRKPGKPVRHYVYAWRGGPKVHVQEGGPKPRLTGTIIDAIAKARSELGAAEATGRLASLIAAYKASRQWLGLSPTTRRSWQVWLGRIEDEFGRAKVGAFNDRRIRGDIMDWRDRWADQPRSADMAVQVLSRLLSWAVERGELDRNPTAGIKSLYTVDRSDIVWQPADFEAFNAKASIEVCEAVELAALTGLRRSDLVAVPWEAVGDHAIVWQTSKSKGRARIMVPLLPETKALLARIKARHAAEMASLPQAKRKPLPSTILSNSRWKPWTPMGLGSRFNDAQREAGLKVHLHDLRGTFATRCMIAGLIDQEIANILGWSTKDVAAIRIKYVDQARVVVGIAERISAARVK